MSGARKGWGVRLSTAALFLLMSNAASAGLIKVGDTIYIRNREGTTGGGEFGVDRVGDSHGDLFRTFCVQKTEHIDFKHQFLVAGIGTAAVGASAPDPLSAETAYLYTRFRTGTLCDYDGASGSGGRTSSANSLQRAFWFLEGDIKKPKKDLQAMRWIQEASDAVSSGLWSGLGDVRVLNLTWLDGRPAQDQLYLVPEPATLTLFGIGVGIAALAARRRRRR